MQISQKMLSRTLALSALTTGLAIAVVDAKAQTTTSAAAPNASAPSTSKSTAAQGSSGKSKPVEVTSFLVLVPVTQASDQRLANGCWVRFYDGRNYRGSNLTLVGPVDMPRMEVPGNAWHDWDSAIVGPKAKVTAFDDENYKDKSATLNPGDHIPDLGDKKLGWFEEVKSARVSCNG